MSKVYKAKPETCVGCPWEHESSGYASGIGPSKANLAVVAESLGDNEAVYGVPLIGWSGQQVNKMLADAGVARADVYLDNVVRCMPPVGNKKKIPKEVVAFCTERHLKPALEVVKPNCILALGDYSLQYLTGKKGISKHRGSIFAGHLGKVVATYHPAFFAHGESAVVMQPFVAYDFERAVAQSAFAELRRPTEDFSIDPNLPKIREFMRYAREVGKVAVDIETSAGSWWNTAPLCVGFYSHDRAVCVPILGYAGANVWSEFSIDEILSLVGDILADEAVVKVFQNENYDIKVLESMGFKVLGRTEDTMIQHHVIYAEKGIPHGLDFIASIYTEVPFYKDDVKGEDNFALLDPTVMRTYNCRDTMVTYIAEGEMQREIDELDVRSTYEQDMQMVRPLMRMERRGVLIDQTFLRQTRKQLDDDIAEAESVLRDVLGTAFNPRSPQQLAVLLFDVLELKPIGFTKSRQPRVDLDAMLMLTDQASPELEPLFRVLLEYRKVQKLRSTYFDEFILDSNGLVHTQYTLHITPTGRLSSRGPNLQNQFDITKELFIARPGFKFISRDYSQIELRIFAELSNDTALKEGYKTKGFDAHLMNAMDLWLLPAPAVTKMIRDTAKTFIYGAIIYGGTAATVRKQSMSRALRAGRQAKVQVPSLAEFERAQSNYLRLHHNVVTFQRGIEDEIKKHRRLRTPLGRVRIFIGAMADVIRAGYNFPIQGTAADIINRALIALDRIIPEPNGVALQCHDELLFEVREREVEEYLILTKGVMEAPVLINGTACVFPTTAKVGYSWASMELVEE